METAQTDIISIVFYAALTFVILAILSIFLVIMINRRAIQHQLEMQALQKAKQQELLTATFEAQEREQQRIGVDIHDDIGPLLSTIKLYLTKLNYAKTDEDRKEQVADLKKQIDDVTQRVRGIARNRVPVVLQEEGLKMAIEQLVHQIDQSEIVRAQLETNFEDDFRLSEKMELNLYRITQELTNNALKHAEASRLLVQLEKREDQLYLAVKDDGKGILPQRLQEVRSGIGLKNVEARASLLNADFHIKSQPGDGTNMFLHIPHPSKPIEKPSNPRTEAIVT